MPHVRPRRLARWGGGSGLGSCRATRRRRSYRENRPPQRTWTEFEERLQAQIREIERESVCDRAPYKVGKYGKRVPPARHMYAHIPISIQCEGGSTRIKHYIIVYIEARDQTSRVERGRGRVACGQGGLRPEPRISIWLCGRGLSLGLAGRCRWGGAPRRAPRVGPRAAHRACARIARVRAARVCRDPRVCVGGGGTSTTPYNKVGAQRAGARVVLCSRVES